MFIPFAAPLFFALHCSAEPSISPASAPQKVHPERVSEEKMLEIYEEVKTPYKYGVVVEAPKACLQIRRASSRKAANGICII
ncbi:MAG: hypothetical protein ACLUKN_07890 [Bacilli bacterium]